MLLQPEQRLYFGPHTKPFLAPFLPLLLIGYSCAIEGALLNLCVPELPPVSPMLSAFSTKFGWVLSYITIKMGVTVSVLIEIVGTIASAAKDHLQSSQTRWIEWLGWVLG